MLLPEPAGHGGGVGGGRGLGGEGGGHVPRVAVVGVARAHSPVVAVLNNPAVYI